MSFRIIHRYSRRQRQGNKNSREQEAKIQRRVHYQGPQGSCDVSLYFTPSGNFGNTIEAGFGYIAAIQDLVLQSNGGIIRLFENTPPSWANLSVYQMRTEGAFLVSAQRVMYHTRFVHVFSERGGLLQLRTSFDEGAVHVFVNEEEKNLPIQDGLVVLNTMENDEVVIYAGNERPEITVHPLHGNENEYHYYGVKSIARL